MYDDMDFHTAKALLDWQVELGATEAICDAPINRYELPKPAPKLKVQAGSTAPPHAAPPPILEIPVIDVVTVATASAAAAQDLTGLQAAMAAYPHCDLKLGARNLVFARGNPAARVMVIGKAPGRDEDRSGDPFAGRAGQLFDRMFGALDMGRDADQSANGVYASSIFPWRPPQDRDPSEAELAMLRPFVQRHVELVAPEILVLMGRAPCHALLGKPSVTRSRGAWTEVFGRPCLATHHPGYLLQNPEAKREAWQDLLMLKTRLVGPDAGRD